jgi:hypothetical protein
MFRVTRKRYHKDNDTPKYSNLRKLPNYDNDYYDKKTKEYNKTKELQEKLFGNAAFFTGSNISSPRQDSPRSPRSPRSHRSPNKLYRGDDLAYSQQISSENTENTERKVKFIVLDDIKNTLEDAKVLKRNITSLKYPKDLKRNMSLKYSKNLKRNMALQGLDEDISMIEELQSEIVGNDDDSTADDSMGSATADDSMEDVAKADETALVIQHTCENTGNLISLSSIISVSSAVKEFIDTKLRKYILGFLFPEEHRRLPPEETKIIQHMIGKLRAKYPGTTFKYWVDRMNKYHPYNVLKKYEFCRKILKDAIYQKFIGNPDPSIFYAMITQEFTGVTSLMVHKLISIMDESQMEEFRKCTEYLMNELIKIFDPRNKEYEKSMKEFKLLLNALINYNQNLYGNCTFMVIVYISKNIISLLFNLTTNKGLGKINVSAKFLYHIFTVVNTINASDLNEDEQRYFLYMMAKHNYDKINENEDEDIPFSFCDFYVYIYINFYLFMYLLIMFDDFSKDIISCEIIAQRLTKFEACTGINVFSRGTDLMDELYLFYKFINNILNTSASVLIQERIENLQQCIREKESQVGLAKAQRVCDISALHSIPDSVKRHLLDPLFNCISLKMYYCDIKGYMYIVSPTETGSNPFWVVFDVNSDINNYNKAEYLMVQNNKFHGLHYFDSKDGHEVIDDTVVFNQEIKFPIYEIGCKYMFYLFMDKAHNSVDKLCLVSVGIRLGKMYDHLYETTDNVRNHREFMGIVNSIPSFNTTGTLDEAKRDEWLKSLEELVKGNDIHVSHSLIIEFNADTNRARVINSWLLLATLFEIDPNIFGYLIFHRFIVEITSVVVVRKDEMQVDGDEEDDGRVEVDGDEEDDGRGEVDVEEVDGRGEVDGRREDDVEEDDGRREDDVRGKVDGRGEDDVEEDPDDGELDIEEDDGEKNPDNGDFVMSGNDGGGKNKKKIRYLKKSKKRRRSNKKRRSNKRKTNKRLNSQSFVY